MEKKRFIGLLMLLLALSLAGCSAAGDEATALMIMYDRVFVGVFWWMLIVGTIASAVIASFASVKLESPTAFVGIVVIGFLLHGCIAYNYSAPTLAEQATTTAWEAAKDDQAAYDEKVTGIWVDAKEVVHQCNYSSFSEAATGCVYVTESCTEDKDGNEDCDYYPWFAYERDLVGVLYDNWQNPTITFATHLAPRDWENNQYRGFGGGVPWSKDAGVDFKFQDDPNWLRVKNALDAGVVLPGSYSNKYSNWQHANDRDLYIQYGGNIPAFQTAGVLPRINPIYNVFDYDIVQFSSQIQLTPDQFVRWQEVAHLWGTQAGQNVEGSLILNFAKQSQVDDTYAWINASKAYLQDEEVFGRAILPKNMVLVNCLVDETQTTITECRLETGMFEGNNGLKADIVDISGVPFTPEGVFGQINASFVKDGNNYVLDENGWRIPDVSIQGGSIGSAIMNGFVRVEMKTKEYLRTSLTPTPEQQENIYWDVVLSMLKNLGYLYVIIIGGLTQSNKRSQ